MFLLYWLKGLVSLRFSGKVIKVEDISNEAFPAYTKQFFSCQLQTHESPLGYRYWLSIIGGCTLFFFLKTSISNVWIWLWWLHLSLLFSSGSLKSLDKSFSPILIDLSCNLTQWLNWGQYYRIIVELGSYDWAENDFFLRIL